MSGSVLYDAPGPRTRRIERLASIALAVVIVAVLAWLVVSLARRGVLDDRWEVLTDPPKQQTASDVWRSLIVVGRGATLRAAVVAAPLALVLALVLAVLRTSRFAIVRRPAVVVIEVLRGMPVLLMMFFGLLGFGLSSFEAVVFGLTLYNAAIIAEILRAGLIALPHGQGCGMASKGESYDLLARTQWGYASHPNFAAVLLVGLVASLAFERPRSQRLRREAGAQTAAESAAL